MCGIAGFLRHRADALLRPELVLNDMTDALVHRGPDAKGLWPEGPAFLGHQRLSIIDIDGGVQPMVGAGGDVITYNGEIYNYKELRRELEEKGLTFKTDSDTEVLLRAFEVWGPDCLERLNGMFAFAIWVPAQKRLFVARDRLGKKPFYYVDDPAFFAFGSEISALMAVPEIAERASLDPFALTDFLALGYIPAPKSIFRHIRKLPAGHFGWITLGTPNIVLRSYWSIAESYAAEKRPFCPEDIDQFRELFDDATKIRLRSDRPVSVFLSAGQDSAAVLSAVVASGRTSGLTALTMGFDEQGFDESFDAMDTARHLGVHSQRLLHQQKASPSLDAVVAQFGEPFADSSMLAMTDLCQAARKAGFPVALSGDGADELLAGYPTYRANQFFGLYRHMPSRLARAMQGFAAKHLKPKIGKVTFDYKVRQFLSAHGLSPMEAHYWWRCLMPDDEIRRLLNPDLVREIGDYRPFDNFREHFADVAKASFLDQCLYVDLKTWLADDILVKVDRTSMSHGLEVRSPFMDHRLVDFCARLPACAKMKLLRQKAILPKAFGARLPGRVFAGRKRGFNAPTKPYLQQILPIASRMGIANQDFSLDPIKDNISYKGFALAILDRWCQANPIGRLEGL